MAENYEIKVLDHYSISTESNFSVEFRPSLYMMPNTGQWNPNPDRLWPNDTWTGLNRIEVQLQTSTGLHTFWSLSNV